MCSFTSRWEKDIRRHICSVHKDDPRFLVHCECLRSFKKWNTFLKHLQRGCSAVQNSASNSFSQSSENTLSDQGFDASDSDGQITRPCEREVPDKQWQQAAYILSIKERYGLTQVAVDHVITSTKVLLIDVFAQLVSRMSSSNHLSPDGLQYLEEECKRISDQLFENLSTPYLQQKYFRENFNFIV